MRAGHDRTANAANATEAGITICVRTLKTPVGVLRVTASEHSVLSLELPPRRSEPALERWVRRHIPHAAETPVLRAAPANWESLSPWQAWLGSVRFRTMVEDEAERT